MRAQSFGELERIRAARDHQLREGVTQVAKPETLKIGAAAGFRQPQLA